MPFNMNTFHEMWGVSKPEEAQQMIEEQRKDAIEMLRKNGVQEPRNLEEQALVLVGRDIYLTLIKGYTEKQWGRSCEDLPAFIIKRLPLRFTYDNNYFNDNYQGIPIGGYNKLTERLLEGAETRTDADFFADRPYWEEQAAKIVFTGRIDEFFDYRLGKLEYRSLRFEHEVMQTPNYQGNAVMNFTEREVPYTRIIEHKHFEKFGQQIYENPLTVITREYPKEWTQGDEPFYPVNNDANNRMASCYLELADGLPNVIFGGRLAEYKYYDMAPVIEKVLTLKDRI